MLNKLTILAQPFGPAIILFGLSVLVFLADKLSLAFLIGSGAASMLIPTMVIGTLLTGFAAKTWWHAVVGTSIAYALSRLLFIKRLDDVTVGLETASFLGAVYVSLLVVGLISGLRVFFLRMKSRSG